MSARILGGAAVAAFPLTILAADLFRLSAERGARGDRTTVDSIISQLIAVDTHRGAFEIASWLFYAAALVTIPMVLTLWHVSVDRAPRLAWTGAVLGALAVTGQIAHVMDYFAPYLAFSAIDHTVGATAMLAFGSNAFSMAVLLPYLLGILFFPPVMALAAWRAGVVPLWGMATVMAGSVAFAVLAGPWWMTVAWCSALLVGFGPVVRRVVRRDAAAPRVERTPVAV